MPTLEQVMARSVEAGLFRASEAWALRHEVVVAVHLANGSPCDSHAAMFAPWPGPNPQVRQWFELASGGAVGVDDSGERVKVEVWDAVLDQT